MTLYVVRHGETDWNHERRLQGRLDVPLNETGLIQARALARHFEGRPLARVLTSPLRRAWATAAVIAEAANCPLERADELTEIHHGTWQGLTIDEIEQRYPDVWASWTVQPSRTHVPGAELLSAVLDRVRRLLQRLTGGGDVCLVTHGVVSQAILVQLMGLAPDALFVNRQANACINVFDIREAGPVVTALNVTTHLEAAVVGPSGPIEENHEAFLREHPDRRPGTTGRVSTAD